MQTCLRLYYSGNMVFYFGLYVTPRYICNVKGTNAKTKTTMKGTKFNHDGKSFEIYNTTEGAFHCVELRKNGTRRSINAKSLTTWKAADFKLGLDLGAITII